MVRCDEAHLLTRLAGTADKNNLGVLRIGYIGDGMGVVSAIIIQRQGHRAMETVVDILEGDRILETG